MGGERGSGPAGVSGPAAVLGRAEKEKKKKTGWARWAGKRVGLFVFFSIPFLLFPFSPFYSKPIQEFLNKLLSTQSIKTHAFNMMHKHLVSLN
jgi:hypothetical protein